MKLPKNLNPLYEPYGQFQVETIGFGVIHNDAGLLLPVGKGKTYCAINICKWRIQNSNVKKILILCPSTIMEKWEYEIMKFAGYGAIILHNPARKERIKLIREFKESNVVFGLINYEALKPYYNYLREIKLDMVIADESARYIKNYVSAQRNRAGKLMKVKRSDAAIGLGDSARYRMILTANLINKPNDIWTQFRFLDKGMTFGDNYWMWRNHYFEQVDCGVYKKWEVKKDKIKKLNRNIFNSCIKFDKEEISKDLPETIYQIIPIKMEKKLRDIYEAMRVKIKAEIETEHGTAVIDIPSLFTKILRYQQITAGFIKDEDRKIKELKHKPKINAIIEEVESIIDSGESAVIWCRFIHTMKMISEILDKKKIKYTMMYGETKNKGKVWKDYQKSKTVNIFLGQIMAGGIGIELFKIDSTDEYQHVLFAENVFGLDPRDQAIGRTEQRIGQNSKCRVVDFIVKDTIDEKIYDSILKDEEIADAIMKDGVTNWL